MKDNLDIEKLFKEKFEHFEGDVSSGAWSNISTSINSATKIAGKTGLSLFSKVLILSSAAVLSTVFVINVISSDDIKQEEIRIVDSIKQKPTVIEGQKNIPVITNKKEILKKDNLVETTKEKKENVIEEETYQSDKLQSNGLNDITSTITNSKSIQVKEEFSDKGELEEQAGISQNNNKTIVEVVDDNVQNINETEHVKNTLSKEVFATLKLEQDSDNALLFNFTSNAGNYESIEWYFGDGQVSFDLNPTHHYNNYGIYNVQLILVNLNGEKQIIEQTVKAFETSSIVVPNVFTPNGNGFNDVYSIESRNLESLSFKVFDKHNKLVYQVEGVDFKWDGRDLSGDKLDNGTYIYFLNAMGKDEIPHKKEGHLSIR